MGRIAVSAITAALLAVFVLAGPALGQKGMGDATGIARGAETPALATMSGVVRSVDVGSCERTTGRSLQGVHLIVGREDGTAINLHLGPAAALEDLTGRLTPGQEIGFEAFRTDVMPPDAWVAKSVRVDDTTFDLRDETLRPMWAVGPRGGRAGTGPGGMGAGGGAMGGAMGGAGPGGGMGQGAGACWW